MPSRARVDAVIPTFDAPPAVLAAAVESCLACPEIGRVIVVDDGSNPAAAAPSAEPRVELVRQVNAGPSAARNTGLERVGAEYALLLDHDDVLERAGVGAMLALADRTGAVATIAARYERLPSGERRLKEAPEEYRDGVLRSADEVFRPLAIFGASGCLIRRSAIERGLRFDPGLWIGEDRDFLRRAGDLGAIAVCATPSLCVTIHRGGRNLSSPAHLARRVRDHLRILEKHGGAGAAAGLCEQTRWLLNALARQRGGAFDAESWGRLAAAARERRWPVPIKSRLRVMVRKVLPHAS
jgi:glycosyltransferase involved in cell wall biosynthesis